MAGRCKLVAGNFFESVPAGADAYLLEHLVPDWDDARAIAIISNCRKAMARNATLLIVERVMPERADKDEQQRRTSSTSRCWSIRQAAASGLRASSVQSCQRQGLRRCASCPQPLR